MWLTKTLGLIICLFFAFYTIASTLVKIQYENLPRAVLFRSTSFFRRTAHRAIVHCRILKCFPKRYKLKYPCQIGWKKAFFELLFIFEDSNLIKKIDFRKFQKNIHCTLCRLNPPKVFFQTKMWTVHCQKYSKIKNTFYEICFNRER